MKPNQVDLTEVQLSDSNHQLDQIDVDDDLWDDDNSNNGVFHDSEDVVTTIDTKENIGHVITGRGGCAQGFGVAIEKVDSQRWQKATNIRRKIFDSDPRYKHLFDPGEFIHWGPANVGEFLRAEQANPGLFKGLGNLGDIDSLIADLNHQDMVTNGCRQNRGTGMGLYQFRIANHGQQLVTDLLSPIDELRAEHLDHSEIWQVGSGGGAFASAGLQMDAWIITDRLAKAGFERFDMTLALFLPGTVPLIDRAQVNANHHAFMLELNASYQDLPPIQVGPTKIKRRPTYSLIQIYDGSDEGGKKYTQQEVFDIAAKCWWRTNFCEPIVADIKKQILANVKDKSYWPYIGFSQNIHELILPVGGELEKTASLEQMKRQYQQYLQIPEHIDLNKWGKSGANDWLRQNHINPEEIDTLFNEFRKKNRIIVDLKPLRKQPLSQVKKALDKMERERFPSWEQQLDTFVEQTVNGLETVLAERMAFFLNQPEHTPLTLQYLLDHDPDKGVYGLPPFLADLQQRLRHKQIQHQREMNLVLAELNKRPFFLFRWGRKVFDRPVSNTHLKNITNLWQRRLLVLQYEKELLLIEKLKAIVINQRQAMETWAASIQKALALVEDMAARYAHQRQQRPVYETSVLTPVDEQRLLAHRIDQAVVLATSNITYEWQEATNEDPGKWVLQHGPAQSKLRLDHHQMMTVGGLKQLVTGFYQGYYADLQEISIEDFLLSRGDTPVSIVEALKKKATPLASVDPNLYNLHQHGNGKKEISLRYEYHLASELGDRHFLASYRPAQNFRIVATGEPDKHRISLLTSVFHLDVLGLKETRTYEADYLRLTAQGSHLHIFNDMVPTAPESQSSSEQVKTGRSTDTKGRNRLERNRKGKEARNEP